MRYREKWNGEVVEAFRWTAGPDQTADPVWIVEALRNNTATIHRLGHGMCYMKLDTPGGPFNVSVGDYLIRDSKGIYPCQPAKFEKNYEAVGS